MQDKKDFNRTNGSKGKIQELKKKKKSHRGHGCLCCVVKRRLWTVRDTKGRKMINTEQKWIKGENPGISKKKKKSQVSLCEISGGQSGTGTGFSPSCRFSPVNFIPLVLHYL
jgi:hypothetical protein